MRPALLLLVAACTSYDPNLGDKPFLCGTDEPRCPDGYTPIGVVRCECLRDALVPDAGVGYACDNDPWGPNDSFQTPTVTVLGTNGNLSMDFRAAVCPAGDVDNYQMTITTTSAIVTAIVTFDTAQMAPKVDILDGGASLQPALTFPRGQIKATATTNHAGKFVAQVSGSQEVNYTLSVTITPLQ
jgi:hypothetical protein